MTEREAYIALNMMERVGPVAVRALVERLGSAAAIFDADLSSLMSAQGVGPETAASIMRQRAVLDVDREISAARELGAGIVSWVDDDYPELLREIHDPPLALYVRGQVEAENRRVMALVGTRRPSSYGRQVADRLAYELSEAGFVVISGLAEGIDAVAHRGALKAGKRTWAVLGGAIDCMYPVSNKGLSDEIAAQGAVMSEFPLGRRPDKTTFPMRNRIVSGLSIGVVVVEAAHGSGALITARQAMEQGRSVFAVPGRIDSPGSQGCHGLIRDGATLIASVDDILEDYEYLFSQATLPRRPGPVQKAPQLSEEEALLIEALDQGEGRVDCLIRDSGLQPAAVSALLLGLEMKKVVKMLPGQVVELVRADF
jgi:DNA processing protein